MFDNASILITGGTGSFGKRFIKRVFDLYKPRRVIVFSRDELKQYEMQKALSNDEYDAMRYFIGDVRDYERLRTALRGVDYVVHAAALKHVNIAEYNPFEYIKTNVLGAQNVINACIECGVKSVVALSTDKACNPVNLYGATKLCSDKSFAAGNVYSGVGGPLFSVVRYGNVIGSRGSVIPFFMKEKQKGIIPITDERMTRFLISLDQGIDLVLKAFSSMKGGEIFVPKIPSMKVVDIAKAVAPSCETKIVGVRPGEKMHEAMIGWDDAMNTRDLGSHYIILPSTSIDSTPHSRSNDGEPVTTGFSYTSDNNTDWMSIDDLLAHLSQYELGNNELVFRS